MYDLTDKWLGYFCEHYHHWLRFSDPSDPGASDGFGRLHYSDLVKQYMAGKEDEPKLFDHGSLRNSVSGLRLYAMSESNIMSGLSLGL